jgi:hypothetical protein
MPSFWFIHCPELLKGVEYTDDVTIGSMVIKGQSIGAANAVSNHGHTIMVDLLTTLQSYGFVTDGIIGYIRRRLTDVISDIPH